MSCALSKPAVDSRKILYPLGNNDECLTPEYAVTPLVKYLPKGRTIWCPFDKADSQFVIVLAKHGFKVVRSHISEGKNFFDYEPDCRWDLIVSNPPFTDKRKIFERALSFDKPFALLMSNTWLNDSAPKQLFRHRQLQLLMFEKRIDFVNSGQTRGRITFGSSYFCCGLLPRDIVIEDFGSK